MYYLSLGARVIMVLVIGDDKQLEIIKLSIGTTVSILNIDIVFIFHNKH